MSHEPIEEGQRLALLRAMLDGEVLAVNAIGDLGAFIELPESVDWHGPSLVGARSGLDLVQASDRVVLIRAWGVLRERGLARCPARLISGHHVVFNFVDVTATHGVVVAVVTPGVDVPAVEALAGFPHTVTLAPRVCRMRRNEMAAITHIDEATTAMLGWTTEHIQSVDVLDLLHPDDQGRAIHHWIEVLGTPGGSRRWRARYRRSDGTYLWMETTTHNLLDDPEHACVLAESLDISDEMAMHEALEAREALLAGIADTVPIGLAQVDGGDQVVYANPRLADVIAAVSVTRLEDIAWRCLDRVALLDAIALVRSGVAEVDLELRFASRDDDVTVCATNIRPAKESGGDGGIVLVLLDVTEQAQMKAELEVRATYDHLTACLNRETVMSELRAAVRRDHEVGSSTAVLFVDLDGFKAVNDALGHACGDALLAATADRLRDSVRRGDVVGRLGGDEFLIVCRDTGTVDEARAVADRVLEALREPMLVEGVAVATGASIGIAWGPAGALDPEALVGRADAAMYEAKRGEGRAAVLAR